MMVKRDSHIDNIKIFLLFAVAFAHNLIPFKEQSIVIEETIKFLYLFHMPLFTFCTGYLVCKSKHSIWGYIKKLLVPYVVFQLAYVVLGFVMIQLGVIDYSTDTMQLSLVEPSSPLYFLVCMMFWRLLCPVFDEVKSHKMLTAGMLIIIGVLTSCDGSSNTMLLPCFALLPFYYMGYVTDWEKLTGKVKQISVIKCLCMLAVYVALTVLVPYETILFRVNVWQMEGMFVSSLALKVLYYLIAVLGGVIAIRFIPGGDIKGITQMNSSNMIIYIGSSFLSPYLYIVLYGIAGALLQNPAVNVIVVLIYTAVTIWILSWKCWMKLYNFVFERFTS